MIHHSALRLMTGISLLLISLLAFSAHSVAQSLTSDLNRKPVKLMQTEVSTTGGERRFFGRIAARETIDLAFQVGGQIQSFPVIEGSFVDEGDTLAQLNLSPLERSVRQAELSLEQAERTLSRNQQLAQRDAITTAQLEDSRTARDQADVSLQDARAALDDATLTSPFDGLVAERIVPNRTTISAGQPVLRLHDMSELRVRINIPERLISEIGNPDNLSFRLELTQGGPQYDLELREYIAEAGRIGQSYVATLGLIDAVDSPLLPGASGTVIAQLPVTGQPGIVVPPTAIKIASDRSTHVMVFTAEDNDAGTVNQRAVDIETPDGTTIVVTAGLEPGEEIVATGVHQLEDGAPVRRFTGYRGQN